LFVDHRKSSRRRASSRQRSTNKTDRINGAVTQLLQSADRVLTGMAVNDTPANVGTAAASPDAARRLEIYLADHRAGAAAGLNRAKRFANSNAGDFLGESAARVCRQIEEDVGTLDEILIRLECRPSRLKIAVARCVESLGRLKPNGQLRGYSPLSRLVELELLIAGILTKESLWQTLAIVQQHRPELLGIDFEKLLRQAMQQRIELESHREQTVNAAFPA